MIKNALNDYNKIQRIENPELYNKNICDGILQIQKHENLELGVNFFKEALKLYPNKMEPNFYIFASYISIYNKTNKSDTSQIEYSLKHLRKALNSSPNNPSILYYKSLMALIFEENLTIVQDLTQAIDIVEDSHAEYYFLRGVALADLGLHPQAYSDFSLALSFNAEWPECYFNRSICSQFLGDINGALSDFKIFLSLSNPKENNELIIAHFFFGCGFYEEAVKSYTLIEEKEFSAIIEKIKCFVHMKELNLCLDSLKKLLETSDFSEDFANDNDCLLALKEASISLLGDQTESFNYRIKINKIIENGKNGMIFKISDFYFYKAVFCFYDTKYQEAIDNFIKSYQVKSFLSEIKKDNLHSENDTNKNELLSEVSSFTFHEYIYNLIICSIQVSFFFIELLILKLMDFFLS